MGVSRASGVKLTRQRREPRSKRVSGVWLTRRAGRAVKFKMTAPLLRWSPLTVLRRSRWCPPTVEVTLSGPSLFLEHRQSRPSLLSQKSRQWFLFADWLAGCFSAGQNGSVKNQLISQLCWLQGTLKGSESRSPQSYDCPFVNSSYCSSLLMRFCWVCAAKLASEYYFSCFTNLPCILMITLKRLTRESKENCRHPSNPNEDFQTQLANVLIFES